MKYNINVLRELFRQLPEPEYYGQVYELSLKTRVDQLNTVSVYESQIPIIKNIKTKKIRAIAEEFCENGICWLEWSLEL